MSYFYDPDTRRYVADLLYLALPEFYRSEDQPPHGQAELERLLAVLGVPLAIARQSIEELHADFFIDKAGDWALPYLAEMIGMRLVFPDADSNRRDIRSTIAFRRRKGSPRMLQDLGETLTGHMVVTQEGWKLVQMTQDLNLLRPERLVPDLRPAITAEIGAGPLNALHHVVDLRAISRTTGQFHAKHVFHWAHPTLLFPLEDGVPADLRDPVTDPDFRWAFHPLGRLFPLRAQRADSSDRELRTDRTPPLHFDRSPGVWFGRTGRFSVRICGVTAGVAAPLEQGRLAARRLATGELLAGNPTLTVLEQDPRRFRGIVRVALAAVTLAGDVADTATPAAVEVRGGVEVSEAGVVAPVPGAGGASPAGSVAMIRLEAVSPTARAFPGLTVAIESDVAAAGLASEDAALAQEGFLRGALAVRLPAAQIVGERWFYLAADGSVYEAQTAGVGAADVAVPIDAGVRQAPASALLVTGPGPAWPPLPPAGTPTPLVSLPNAPNRGPAVLHGGRVVDAGFAEVGAGVGSALTFALRIGIFGPAMLHPFLRLQWNGPDPSSASWTAVADDALPVALDNRLAEIAQLRDDNPEAFRLVVRAESAVVDARIAPAEVAWTSYDGDSTLLHLPELRIQNGTPEPTWLLGAGLNGASDAVAMARDGSVWNVFFSDRLRQSLGAVAPIRERVDLRRRRVRYRHLCPWINEDPALGLMLAATQSGRLDIDPANGLFSMAGDESPQALPVGPDGAPPPAGVTVAYQDGYSDHIGARPTARESLLDQRLARPTRLVSGSGQLRSNAPREWHDLPRFRTLGEALVAIAADPAPAGTEVIEFQDSATYTNETIDWPANATRLIIQAAEGERPVIQVQSWTIAAGALYEELILRGLFIGGAGAGALALPPAAAVRVEFCTVSHPENELQFALAGAEIDRIRVVRSLTAGLRLDGPGRVEVADSVVDAGDNPAMTADEGWLQLDRITVLGTVTTLVIDASETIFRDHVTVQDRFRGCVRYSRVTGESVLPRVHRVVVDTPLSFASVDPFDRHDPAHVRLAADADRALLRGAEDGGEMGAFHNLQLAQRYEGYRRRLDESTPAGLTTGIIRLD
jgi:hypothetical protein